MFFNLPPLKNRLLCRHLFKCNDFMSKFGETWWILTTVCRQLLKFDDFLIIFLWFLMTFWWFLVKFVEIWWLVDYFLWFLMIFDDFLMIFDDVWWFFDDFWWFSMIFNDFRWFLMIFNDFSWFLPIYSRSWLVKIIVIFLFEWCIPGILSPLLNLRGGTPFCFLRFCYVFHDFW